jgi:Actin-fragmin kinase, catalytic
MHDCLALCIFQVTVNSGGVVFIALLNTPRNDNISKEGAAVIKIASSRMATQSERLGYEFARWLGVRTPQVCFFPLLFMVFAFRTVNLLQT